ncbi:protein kinase [Archangium violaceum]|uniref:protein kinase domain-containing protein n=1 Tax=Archangium violaceum TaxID=83451 RepID=UPI00194EAAC2|nr:protein kinase [Archangium violaceum]QRN98200.1 protein kinase [Archangium violaceum]
MHEVHIPEAEQDFLPEYDASLAGEDREDFEDSLLGAVSRSDEWPLRIPHPGQRLGGLDGRRFEIIEELGGGAMGRVFRAWDEELQRRVALKFLLPREAPAGEAPATRLKQEARAVARLDHENIVRVFDVAEWSGEPWEPRVPFIVMECLEGESLASLLWRERPDLHRTLGIMSAVAAGLAHAHAHQVIHRDLKPSNVIITREGCAKLLDFGLAYLVAPRSPLVPFLPTAGTPAYMAPEQWRGEPQDERTDLWAAGVMLYELLTGELPYPMVSLEEMRARVLSAEPVPSVRTRRPELPEEVERLVAALLTKAPGQRLRSAAELRERLRGLEEELGPWREPTRPVLPQRRHVTLVSLWLSGLAGQLDPEDASELQAAFHQACAELLREQQGTVALSVGNEVLACFGYPTAHEDDSVRAVHAALQMTQALPGRLPQLARFGLSVAAGIHTDLVVFDGGSLQGEAPRVAAWLARRADPGTVVLGDATWKLVRGAFDTVSLGRHAVEALSGNLCVELRRVVREHKSVCRFERALSAGLSPLVGRERELARLRSLWERARWGEGAFALISGEAGVGKSRLTQELHDEVPPESSHRLLCQCWSQLSHTAFHPLIEMLRRFFQLEPEAPAAEEPRGLEERLAGLGMEPEHVEQLAELLARPMAESTPAVLLSALEQQRERKRKMLEALQSLLLHVAEQRPLLLIVEDLHWADPSTLELLGLLLEHVQEARMLVLLTTRPELRPSWPARPWSHRLVLDRLQTAPTETLVRWMAGSRELPEETVHQLAAKTDGVPLFVEEMTRMVLEQGPGGLLSTIPATLNELLLARLDALPPRQKSLAQLCAVVGRDFDLALLSRISARDEDSLRRGVEELVSARLLRRREEGDGAGYQFRHALLQEAAYQSLPRGLRRQHHRRIAQALLEHFPGRVDSRPEVLAHHRTEAGDTVAAIQAWKRAAELALLRPAIEETVSHLKQALRLMKGLPDTPERRAGELELLNVLGMMLADSQGFDSPELERTYARELELYRQLEKEQETPQHVLLWMGLCNYFLLRAEYQKVSELAEELVAPGPRRRGPQMLAQGYRTLGVLALHRGTTQQALEHFERQRQLMEASGGLRVDFVQDMWIDQRVDAWVLLAITHSLRGELREARRCGREALELLRGRCPPNTLAYGLTFLALGNQNRQEVRSALELLDGNPAVLSTPVRPVQALAKVVHGWALARLGRGREGLEELRGGVELARFLAVRLLLPYVLDMLAETHLALGQEQEGLATVDEALREVEKMGGHFFAPELHRLRGELLRKTGREDEALRCFLRARALAHRHEAGLGLFELRATVSLGRQLKERGCPERARRRLERILSRLEPDPDSVDLREARELLDA